MHIIILLSQRDETEREKLRFRATKKEKFVQKGKEIKQKVPENTQSNLFETSEYK